MHSNKTKKNKSPQVVSFDDIFTNTENYLKETQEKINKIKENNEAVFSKEQESFKNLNENINEFLKGLEEKSLSFSRVSILLNDIVVRIERIVYHLNRRLRKALDNPSEEFKPCLEKGEKLLFKYGIRKSRYSYIDEVSEKALDHEVSLEKEQDELHTNENFNKMLEYSKNVISKRYTPKKAFISYAWPKKDKHHELWTKKFIETFSQDLVDAGFIIYDDQHESGPGKSLCWFMDDKIEDVDHVLVISSRSMAHKYWENGFSGACNEYVDYLERFRREKGDRFIIPVLLNKRNNSPGLVRRFAELSFYNDGYVNAFLMLICVLYGLGEDDIKELYKQVQTFNEPSCKPLSEYLSRAKVQSKNNQDTSLDIQENKLNNQDAPKKEEQQAEEEYEASMPAKPAPAITFGSINNSSITVVAGFNKGKIQQHHYTVNPTPAALLSQFNSPAFSPTPQSMDTHFSRQLFEKNDTEQLSREPQALESSVEGSTALHDITSIGIGNVSSRVKQSNTEGKINSLVIGPEVPADVVREAKNFF